MKLSVRPGKLDKIHIFLDEEYAMTVDNAFWFSSEWYNKTEIDSEELAALQTAVSSRRAFNAAVDLLSRRAHASEELYKKLRPKFGDEPARAAVEKAKSLYLLDDEAFAEQLAEELYERKHFAPRRILSELLRRGVNREIAQNAVESLDKDDKNRIIVLLQGKYSACLQDEKGKRRAVNALMRMGYGYGDIKAALAEVNSETEELFDA